MANGDRDIYPRIKNFVLSVLVVVGKLPKTEVNKVLVNQVIRSATSIGANANEADGAGSKNDFINKWFIAKKEAKETVYWLELIESHNRIGGIEKIISENKEIVAIISSIIINTRKK